MSEEIKVTDSDRESYYRQLVPFGYADVDRAILTAMEAGEDADYAAECVLNDVESCGVKIEDADPVASVYEALLQVARNEIQEYTNFDIWNDVKGTELHVAGNYICTSYDYSEETIQEIVEKLAEYEIEIADLSTQTQWVLQEIEITQDRINETGTNT